MIQMTTRSIAIDELMPLLKQASQAIFDNRVRIWTDQVANFAAWFNRNWRWLIWCKLKKALPTDGNRATTLIIEAMIASRKYDVYGFSPWEDICGDLGYYFRYETRPAVRIPELIVLCEIANQSCFINLTIGDSMMVSDTINGIRSPRQS